MRYIVDCPEVIHNRVIQLIAEGRYASMQGFILTAMQNQLVIEDSPAGVQEHLDEYETSDNSEGNQLRTSDLGVRIKEATKPWQLSSIRADSVMPVSDHASEATSGWLFGQVNRILPVKFGLRILMESLQDKGKWIPLEWFHERASEQARRFGKRLEQQDQVHERKRSDRFSVGFPIGKPSKSLQRYRSQFLGYRQPTTGAVVGALPALYWAVVSDDEGGNCTIGITSAGLRFGLLPNPVLDKKHKEHSFSEEEAYHYVQHICEYVPGEADALRTILQLIADDCDSPGALDTQVGQLFPEWTETQVTTNRSGALGRVWDLGFVEKEREGIRVRYALSELGEQALEELNRCGTTD